LVFGESPLYEATKVYEPGALGEKLVVYCPSPLTFTAVGPKATVVQLLGPYAVKVMVPFARLPAVVGVMTGVPGSLAVPLSVAVSVMVAGRLVLAGGVPTIVADVTSVGVTGRTVKHSVALLSEDFGTAGLELVYSARQQ
jgi:hypothetical protein